MEENSSVLAAHLDGGATSELRLLVHLSPIDMSSDSDQFTDANRLPIWVGARAAKERIGIGRGRLQELADQGFVRRVKLAVNASRAAFTKLLTF